MSAETNTYYILVDGQEAGPFAPKDLSDMLQNGEISPETLCATYGMSSWEPVSTLISQNFTVNPSHSPTGTAEPTDGPVEYDDQNFIALLGSFSELCDYQEASVWKLNVQTELARIEKVTNELQVSKREAFGRLAQAQKEFSKQSFLKRTFGDHDTENAVKARISNLDGLQRQLSGLKAKLQKAFEATPTTPAEKAELIRRLKERKDELRIQKRERTATMSAIREAARLKSAEAGKTWIFYDSGLAADQRRGIRSAKESSLRPLEEERASIEREIINIDKDLLWLKRFS